MRELVWGLIYIILENTLCLVLRHRTSLGLNGNEPDIALHFCKRCYKVFFQGDPGEMNLAAQNAFYELQERYSKGECGTLQPW